MAALPLPPVGVVVVLVDLFYRVTYQGLPTTI